MSEDVVPFWMLLKLMCFCAFGDFLERKQVILLMLESLKKRTGVTGD